MRFSPLTLLSAALLTAPITAQYNNQSAPFELVLLSSNTTINGSTLSACHEGAAIEGACLSRSISISQPSPLAASTFYMNYTENPYTPNVTLGTPGYLTYLLVGGNFAESEPMALYIQPTSNVALPLFEPGTEGSTSVAFDTSDFLNIQSYVDDTKVPVATQETTAYYRWYACTTYFESYTYNTLSWVLGEAPPQNPTCQKVMVKRIFL